MHTPEARAGHHCATAEPVGTTQASRVGSEDGRPCAPWWWEGSFRRRRGCEVGTGFLLGGPGRGTGH